MKDIVQQITKSRSSTGSTAFRLYSFEHTSQNREFCKEALEKRPLYGGAMDVYVVRQGYEEEFRKRVREYVTGMLIRRSEIADAKKAYEASNKP
jgi:hypothetical protein